MITETRSTTAERLKKNGIRPSLQRLAVYENLVSRKDHPTAEMIFNDLRAAVPTLSLTTVYSTLKVLAERGLILVVSVSSDEARYDGDTSFHAHVICRRCGRLEDVPANETTHVSLITPPCGWCVDEEQVTCFGVCPACAGLAVN